MVVLYKNPSRQFTKIHSGFTLIELLVVISVAAILVSMAVPSFSQMAAEQRAKSAANEFRSAVKLARSEARKQNRNTSVAPGGNQSNANAAGFNAGWEVYYMEFNSFVRVPLERHTINNGTLNVTSDGKYFYFAPPYGRLIHGAGAVQKVLCFSDSAGGSDAMRYKVTIHQASSVDVEEVASC